MGLQTDFPLWVRQAISNRGGGVVMPCLIFGLEEKMGKPEVGKVGGSGGGFCLGVNQLELIALPNHKVSIGFGAYTNPIDFPGDRERSVGFHRYFKAPGLQFLDEWHIELE